MSKTLLLIDNVAFAKKREQLDGHLTLSDCQRLTELLNTEADVKVASGTIQYNLQGDTNSLGQHQLHLSIEADLTATCQRCLSPMQLKLDLQFHYLITNIESDQPEESDEIDLQEPSPAMDLLSLIEDEVIMAVPIAPTHKQNCGPQVTTSGEKPNPFAVLKGFIKP
jgi:uncharacterized protein